MGAKINSSAWESQPFLSSDGRFLIFSSNRKGGFGKRDLYFSRKVDGDWITATNLGDKVNTFADEISPFLTLSNDELFFSSNGRVGMGGFDIYKINWPIDGGEVRNIGLPINTFNNELSYHQKFGESCIGLEKFSLKKNIRLLKYILKMLLKKVRPIWFLEM